MKRIFILGTTKYAFMIHSMIEQEQQYEVLGHTVSKSQIEKNKGICDSKGVQLCLFKSLNDYVDINESILVLNAIGYTNMNRTRQKMYDECLNLGYQPVNFISKRAIVLSEVSGVGNIIFPGAYIGTNVVIGNNNVFYAGSVMTHDIVIIDHNFIAANVTSGGEVKIGCNCFIGMGAVLRNRISIADYSLIGADAYVSHSTEEEEVIVPAKSISLDKSSFEMSLTPK